MPLLKCTDWKTWSRTGTFATYHYCTILYWFDQSRSKAIWRWCCNYILWQEVPCPNGARQEWVQILIALCSNVLETMTVVVFGDPLGFITYGGSSSLWYLCTDLWKNESLLTSLRSCRVHHPSDNFICETLVCLSQSCITYLAPLFWTLSSNWILLVWWGSHTMHPYSNVGRTSPVNIWFLICDVVPLVKCLRTMLSVRMLFCLVFSICCFHDNLLSISIPR